MIITPKRNSRLYETVSELGLLYTPQAAIDTIRKKYRIFEKVHLSNTDVKRISYNGPHFITKESEIPYIELWVDDEYINPNDIEWIKVNSNRVYGILPKEYKDLTNVKSNSYFNHNIIHRYTATPRDDTDKTYHFDFDTADIHYNKIENPEMSCYYISENQIRIPEYEWLSDTKIRVHAPYKNDIDFFMCSNLVSITKATANIGVYVDYPSSKQCYYSFVIDNDDLYPINVAFYPCVLVNKDCIIRLYSDKRCDVNFPYTCRLTLYPEFMDIEDPYNCDDLYLNQYIPSSEHIERTDTDDEILLKFATIVAGSYRMWENYPHSSLEESDFIICDNTDLADPTFVKFEYHDPNGNYTGIRSVVPYEESRDILFYNGKVLCDYTPLNIYHMTDGSYEVNDSLGSPVYVIPDEYDPDKLTLVKFNAAEDTHLINSNNYFNKDNFLQLHYKVNRFYRNLLTLKREVLDVDDDEQVRVSTSEPKTIDEHLWFELLVNVQPEMFQTNVIDKIDVTKDEIPDPIRNGAYRIDTETLTGNKSYYNALLTYLELGKRQRDKLIFQYGDGIKDPTTMRFHSIDVGDINKAEHEINRMVINDPTIDPVKTKTEIEYGPMDDPGTLNHIASDLYVKIGDYEAPKSDNIDISNIEYGDYEAKRDESTLWIDPDDIQSDSSKGGLPYKNEWDGVVDRITSVNDPSDVDDAKSGDMIYDAIDDDYTGDKDADSAITSEETLNEIQLKFEDTGTFIKEELEFEGEGESNSDENVKMDEADEDDDLDLDALLNGIDTDDVTNPVKETGDDVFTGLSKALSEGITVDKVKNPTTGMFAFDGITFNDPIIEGLDLDKLSISEKMDLIRQVIIDDDRPENAKQGQLWLEYISRADEKVINTIVQKIYLMKNIYEKADAIRGELRIEGDGMPDLEARRVVYGDDEVSVRPDQIMISHLPDNGDGIPDYVTNLRKTTLDYILSKYEPEDPEFGLLWLNIPAVPLIDFIADIIASIMLECGVEPPVDLCFDDEHTTIAFDYGAHGTDIETELFQEVVDDTLHPMYFDEHPDIRDIEHDDIWIEFLDDIREAVCYSDETTMVLRVNNHLYGVQFDNDNVTTFLFDDIVLNFKHSLGVKYLSILADLVNANVIKLEDVNIFYKRLITDRDSFDPMLRRLYTGTSHVVSMAKVADPEYIMTYSSNIGRFKMDYRFVSDDCKEAAYRMVIDYTDFPEFAFLHRRMLLFVNGKFIPADQYHEEYANKIQLLDFHEIIATVDVLYSKKDEHLMKMKRLANTYWTTPDSSKYIDHVDEYGVMEPIDHHEYTYQGFYDVFIREYIENNRLINILNYLNRHPDEYEAFKKDFIEKFYDITDVAICKEGTMNNTHVVIPLTNSGEVKYDITNR